MEIAQVEVLQPHFHQPLEQIRRAPGVEDFLGGRVADRGFGLLEHRRDVPLVVFEPPLDRAELQIRRRHVAQRVHLRHVHQSASAPESRRALRDASLIPVEQGQVHRKPGTQLVPRCPQDVPESRAKRDIGPGLRAGHGEQPLGLPRRGPRLGQLRPAFLGLGEKPSELHRRHRPDLQPSCHRDRVRRRAPHRACQPDAGEVKPAQGLPPGQLQVGGVQLDPDYTGVGKNSRLEPPPVDLNRLGRQPAELRFQIDKFLKIQDFDGRVGRLGKDRFRLAGQRIPGALDAGLGRRLAEPQLVPGGDGELHPGRQLRGVGVFNGSLGIHDELRIGQQSGRDQPGPGRFHLVLSGLQERMVIQGVLHRLFDRHLLRGRSGLGQIVGHGRQRSRRVDGLQESHRPYPRLIPLVGGGPRPRGHLLAAMNPGIRRLP